VLQNDDMLPVPLEKRTWKWWNFVTFWLADAWNVNTWTIASTMIAAGLSWWQAWTAVWIGYSIAACFMVLNGHAGSKYHCSFPVLTRATFGIWGSLWPILNRALMACVWYSVQGWIGGQCVYLLIQSIWPSFSSLPNMIPSSGTDSAHFLSFAIFSLVSLIPIYFPIHQIRHFFTIKARSLSSLFPFSAVVAPTAGTAFFIWFVVKAGGVGTILQQPARAEGKQLQWAFINAAMGCISNMVTLITNNQDFSARADKTSSMILPQLIALPMTFGMVSFFGIIVSSSSNVLYGHQIWDPLELLERVLTGSPTIPSRVAVGVISLSFTFSQMGTNVAANSVSAGCDMAALFPRFINIRRGSYIAAVLGFCMMPWELLDGPTNFSTYLSAYSVFLSSMIGCLLAEYYVVSKRLITVKDLYVADSSGIYYYFHGVNWRAYLAYFSGLALNMPGFVGMIQGQMGISVRIYQLSFFTGLGSSFIVYIILNRLFPTRKSTIEEAQSPITRKIIDEKA
ncbi:uncharacterized protein MELLADRAFT_32428, partial [Melampsora larici-populina 98AG31]